MRVESSAPPAGTAVPLTLTGSGPAAAAAAVIVYRVAGCWAVGTTGTALADALARCPPGGRGRDASRQPAGGPPPCRLPASLNTGPAAP